MEVFECDESDVDSSSAGNARHIYRDEVVRISQGIPDSLDLGTVTVELTCISSSSSYIIIGSCCGTLFIYNRKLGRLEKPLRTNSFESVTCIHQLHLQDDYVAIGHNTGTLIVLRLLCGQDGASNTLSISAQCIDTDSHRRSPITCVAWNHDATKVVSGDVCGTVIISSVFFDTGEFYHSFLFEGCTPIAALWFCDSSVLVHNGMQLVVLNHNGPSTSDIISEANQRTTVLGLRCTSDLIYVAECDRICKYSSSFSALDTITARQIKDGVTSFRDVKWNESITKVAVLSDSCIFIVYDLLTSNLLWSASVGSSLQTSFSSIEGFCVDFDDSILYTAKPHQVHRLGITPIEQSMLEEESDYAISQLLSSPKKLLTASASRFTQSVSFLSNAFNTGRDLGSNNEVTNILEDVLANVNFKEELKGIFLDMIDPSENGTIFQRHSEQDLSAEVSSYDSACVTEELPAAINIVSEERLSRCKRSRSEPQDISKYAEMDSCGVDDSAIMAIRRQVLGDTIIGTSKSGGSLSGTPTWTPGESPKNVEHMLLEEVSRTVMPNNKTSEAAVVSSIGDNVSNSSESASILLTGQNTDESAQEVLDSVPCVTESVAGAYEYLMQHNADLSSHPDKIAEFGSGGVFDSKNLAKYARPHVRTRPDVVLNDRVDIWFKAHLPYTAKCFTVGNKHVILCHRKKSPRFIAIDDLVTKNSDWRTAKWSATSAALNGDESIVWIVQRKKGLCAVEPLSATTRFIECASDGEGVLEVALGANDAWYTTKEGVSLQMELPEKAIFSKIDCDWPMVSISVSADAVWAIRADTGNLVVRVGLARCKMGTDWVEIVPEGPCKLVSVCTYRAYGFALDNLGQLWMTTGVDKHHPYGNNDAFYKICLPAFDTRTASYEDWTIRASSAGLFLCVGKELYMSRSAVSGHKFVREVPSKFEIVNNFSLVSAGSFNGEEGSIYACRQNSEIFAYSPIKRNFITISMPKSSCAIISLCGCLKELLMIDSTGRVLHHDNDFLKWEEDVQFPVRWPLYKHSSVLWQMVVDLGSIIICHLTDDVRGWPSQGAACSLARGKLASWAITCDGNIVTKPFNAVTWTVIASPPSLPENTQPSQIFCSPNGIYVWVIAGGRGWARVNVSERNPSGVSWTETYHTSGLSALAVGDNVVWALDTCNKLLRLRGLAAGNPAGNYWRVNGEVLRAISIDARSDLWAIDTEGRLVRHLTDVFLSSQLYNCDIQDSFEFV